MCGICGIFPLDGTSLVDAAELLRMNHVIAHRGPDDSGHVVLPGAGLAMRRLAIIDVSGGYQPIASADQSVHIVFNGEIYNHDDIRRTLENKGYKYKTNSDTETILYAYVEYGVECVKKLRGMFAFAIWDARSRSLFVARDRVGIKPLFYWINSRRLLISSEIKCILQADGVDREIDSDGLNLFLTFLLFPGEHTIFKGIKQLPPGHYMTFKDGKLEIEKYWDLDYTERNDNLDEEEWIEIATDALLESVKMHLVGEVPLGAFLSGGIDSGIMVALMSQVSKTRVETFTVGYEGSGAFFDERRYARMIADRYHTNHHEFVIQPNLEEVLDEVITSFDEPTGNASVIPNYYISKLIRKHATVALSGLGGDEICAGYERYAGMVIAKRFNRLPLAFRKLISEVIRLLPDSKGGNPFISRSKRFTEAVAEESSTLERYYRLICSIADKERNALLSSGIKPGVTVADPRAILALHAKDEEHAGLVNSMLYWDLKLYLPGDLLTLTDRISMRHSLEVRVPYLDHVVLELFARIPSALKLRGLEKKYLLKRIGNRLLPRDVVERPKKGFSVPLTVWFRDQLKGFVESMLSRENIMKTEILNYEEVRRILDAHFSRRANFDNQIWAILNVVRHHQLYFQ